jgi:hypothetical protein
MAIPESSSLSPSPYTNWSISNVNSLINYYFYYLFIILQSILVQPLDIEIVNNDKQAMQESTNIWILWNFLYERIVELME